MDPSACRVIYIDDRFPHERWVSREGLSSQNISGRGRKGVSTDFDDVPYDLQVNVSAILSVFNQVFVCNSGRLFSQKLSELHDSVKAECTPIIALFDVGAESKHENMFRRHARGPAQVDSPTTPSPKTLRRQITFSAESDESYGLQLLSRISSDLQVDEEAKLIIPVAIVQQKRRDNAAHSYKHDPWSHADPNQATSYFGIEDKSATIDSHMMLQCLDAGALDVVATPLDKGTIMGLTVHAYRVYKSAKKEQASFMAAARRGRKQSWVGVEEEKPYAYLREAMVKKLLKGICEPETVIEDYQHRDLFIDENRQQTIASEVGKWSFCGHDFSEDELVYAGYCMLNHALTMSELQKWRLPKEELLHFMQGCRVAYNSFVLYHNFRHAVDVLQSLFYFIVQIGLLPPYPVGSNPPPLSQEKSAVAKILQPFEALTLLISAIGHDVGHPGVNNMFLVKLNAPLAQLYNDQSVLEAFHCAAYSQILRRHWPAAFNDKGLRKLMISSILATDMGVHSDYMQQLGLLQEKIHETQSTQGWAPKDLDAYRVLACGLLIKCADISNVARPWLVAERWTHLLQEEFANQGEMENAVGMETTLFGGPPELGNLLKLANGQIGFMTIFAHPLFQNVADLIPAMSFAAEEILKNKAVWFNRAEQEKRREVLKREGGFAEAHVSPRSQSPVDPKRKSLADNVPGVASPLQRPASDANSVPQGSGLHTPGRDSSVQPESHVPDRSEQASAKQATAMHNVPPSALDSPTATATAAEAASQAEITSPRASGAFPIPSADTYAGVQSASSPDPPAVAPPLQTRNSSNIVPSSRLQIGGEGEMTGTGDGSSAAIKDADLRSSENEDPSKPRPSDATFVAAAGAVAMTAADSHDGAVGSASPKMLSQQSWHQPPPSQEIFSTPSYTPSTSPGLGSPDTGLEDSQSSTTRTSAPLASINTNFGHNITPTVSDKATSTGTNFTAQAPPSAESTSMLSSGDSGDDKESPPQAMEVNSGKRSGRWEKDARSRAMSAPISPPQFPPLVMRMDGNRSGHLDTSKHDVRKGTTRLGSDRNLGVGEANGGDMGGKQQQMPIPSPRRRSRIRLAFWKKRADSEER